MSYRTVRRAALAMTGCALAGVGAAPTSAAEYFADKRITINVGLGAGGGYDLYARFLAQHWGRHIPGNPGIIVQNRTGAGSVLAANYVYSAAPKDGTQLAFTLNVTPVFQVFGAAGVRYDVGKAAWFGNMVNLTSVLAVWHAAPATTMEGVRKTEIIVGTTGGRTGEAYIYAVMMKAFTGAKFKIVGGYPGGEQLNLAMERGEIHARSNTWNSYEVTKPDWIANKTVLPLVQIGLKKDPAIPESPLLTDLALDEGARQVLEIICATGEFSRAPWGPPEMPKEAVEILRRAFDATMKDAEFLADAKKRKFEIDASTGERIESLAKKMVAVPPAVIERAKAAMDMK